MALRAGMMTIGVPRGSLSTQKWGASIFIGISTNMRGSIASHCFQVNFQTVKAGPETPYSTGWMR